MASKACPLKQTPASDSSSSSGRSDIFTKPVPSRYLATRPEAESINIGAEQIQAWEPRTLCACACAGNLSLPCLSGCRWMHPPPAARTSHPLPADGAISNRLAHEHLTTPELRALPVRRSQSYLPACMVFDRQLKHGEQSVPAHTNTSL